MICTTTRLSMRPGPVLALVLALLAMAALPAAGQNDFSEVKITATDLGGGIAMLEGAGGNLGVCYGEDGVFLIDDQFAPLTDKILAAIAELSAGPVKFVFNTHWHGDHTGGNENLGKAGSLIVSHDNVRKRLATDQFSAFFDRTIPASPAAALPVVTFNDSLTFHFNGEEIVAFHVEHAHTDGDGIIHFRSNNVVHAGDILFFGLYPYIDVGAGGSIGGMIEATRTILGICDEETRIIPGHGPLLNRGQVAEYLSMLEGARDAVAAARSANPDLEAVKAAAPLAEWDEAWGKAWLTSDQFTEMIWSSLDAR